MSRAIRWNGNKLDVIEREPQPLAPDEARIRLILGGICNTDLELMDGYKGFQGVLGHEFVGEVLEVADETQQHWVGKRVAGVINASCGNCDMCNADTPSQCRDRTALGIDTEGCFAENFVMPVRNLREVPANVPDAAAVFTEPLAAACRITELHDINASHKVVLIGAGKLGMLCAQVIHLTGADLTVVVRREKQTELLNKWSITAVKAEDVPPAQADFVIEVTGNEQGFDAALGWLRPRGTLVLKSTFNGLTPANLTDVAVREIRIEGSRCGPFDVALNLLAGEKVDVGSMIEATYNLDAATEAFDHAAQRGILKILLQP